MNIRILAVLGQMDVAQFAAMDLKVRLHRHLALVEHVLRQLNLGKRSITSIRLETLPPIPSSTRTCYLQH